MRYDLSKLGMFSRFCQNCRDLRCLFLIHCAVVIINKGTRFVFGSRHDRRTYGASPDNATYDTAGFNSSHRQIRKRHTNGKRTCFGTLYSLVCWLEDTMFLIYISLALWKSQSKFLDIALANFSCRARLEQKTHQHDPLLSRIGKHVSRQFRLIKDQSKEVTCDKDRKVLVNGQFLLRDTSMNNI